MMDRTKQDLTPAVDVPGATCDVADLEMFHACCLGCRTTVTQSRTRKRCPICQRIINPKGAK